MPGAPAAFRFSTPTGPSTNFRCISGELISFGFAQ